MALKENEKFFITSWYAETNLDSYEHGEIGGGSEWDWRDMRFDLSKPFDSVSDALKAVCKVNAFDWEKKNWESWFKEYGEDPGRFDGGFMVDEENCEATEEDLELWKKNRKKLWCCRIQVNVEVRPVLPSRPLTPAEAKDF
jgi:hypothetical protein